MPAGSDITFNVMNHGQSPHTFGVVVDGETIETPSIDVDGSTTLEVPALAAGTYDTLCTVPGHDQLGMVGTLTASRRCHRAGRRPPSGGGTDATSHATMTAEEMAAGHEQGVQDFLAGKETDSYGNQPMKPEMDGDVKVYNFTVEEIQWEIAKGEFVDAMAFNGQVPGPEIRVNDGDRVRFVVQNQMTEPFVLHFHGLTVPEQRGRRALRDPAADHARRVLDLRVHDQGPARHVRLPLALQLGGAGRQGAVRLADRGAEERELGSRCTAPTRPSSTRCSSATARSGTT